MFRDRSLTLVLLGLFAASLSGQILAGWYDFNASASTHDSVPLGLLAYLGTGHFLEATFENWESEFLQMAAFVVLTTFLVQKGSPESRTPGAIELADADPRRFRDRPGAPWPVRRGGFVLWMYERSLGLAFAALFLIAIAGHSVGGLHEYNRDQLEHGEAPVTWAAYVLSARFWFESFQNWQSEFLAIASMVWLAVYLRQRGSPESKPVHAPHSESGR